MLPIIDSLLLKAKIIQQKPAPIYDDELLNQIQEVCNDINLCRCNLKFTSDKTLTDMYIHSLIANEMKYKHLLRIAKKQYDSKCG